MYRHSVVVCVVVFLGQGLPAAAVHGLAGHLCLEFQVDRFLKATRALHGINVFCQ